MKRLLLFFFVLMCVINETEAQSGMFDLLNKPMYEARVKLIDEFIARFNGAEKRKGVSEEYSDRKSNVLMMFDLTKFKSKQDSLFLCADEFVQKVISENILLNYTDSCWYAKVKCNGSLAKKDVDFYLYLIVEKRGDDMYKWSIAKAEGKVFDTSRTRKHRELFISPNDHEMSFMSLSKITDGSNRYIDDYAKDGYEADALSIFLTLARCGQLKINNVSDVEFVFLQVPGYIFSVKHYERESMNVGWLINSFEKCDETYKTEILSSLRPLSSQPYESPNDSVFGTPSDPIKIANHTNEGIEDVSHSEDEEIVCRFGNLLQLWCETKDLYYREKMIELCAGKEGKECLVNDSLMNHFAGLLGLPLVQSYTLRSYLVGFQNIMHEGKIKVSISDIKQVDNNGKFYVVSCTIKINSPKSFESKDLFYIRKKSLEISRISSWMHFEENTK